MGNMRYSMTEQIVVALIFMVVVTDMVAGIRVNVTVPSAVISGRNATIVCDHDLDSDNVYTVKWYKNGHEFFRYTPREFPALKLFWLPGIKVALEESNATHVQLKKVSLKQTGRYSCEVSADAPSFDTKLVSADLEVVVLPLHEPFITGVKEQYQAGELLQANCTSNGSIPSATLEWKINNVPANPYDIIKYEVIKDADTKLETRTIGLHFLLPPLLFVKGKLMIRSCNLFGELNTEGVDHLEEFAYFTSNLMIDGSLKIIVVSGSSPLLDAKDTIVLQCTARIHDLYYSEIIKFIEEDRPQVYFPSLSYLSDEEYNQRNVASASASRVIKRLLSTVSTLTTTVILCGINKL